MPDIDLRLSLDFFGSLDPKMRWNLQNHAVKTEQFDSAFIMAAHFITNEPEWHDWAAGSVTSITPQLSPELQKQAVTLLSALVEDQDEYICRQISQNLPAIDRLLPELQEPFLSIIHHLADYSEEDVRNKATNYLRHHSLPSRPSSLSPAVMPHTPNDPS